MARQCHTLRPPRDVVAPMIGDAPISVRFEPETIKVQIHPDVAEHHPNPRLLSAGFWCDDAIYCEVSRHSQCAPDKLAIRARFSRINNLEFLTAADLLAANLQFRDVKPAHGVRPAHTITQQVGTATPDNVSYNGPTCFGLQPSLPTIASTPGRVDID